MVIISSDAKLCYILGGHWTLRYYIPVGVLVHTWWNSSFSGGVQDSASLHSCFTFLGGVQIMMLHITLGI